MTEIIPLDKDGVRVIVRRNPGLGEPCMQMETTEDSEVVIPYHVHPHGEEYMTVTRGYLEIVLSGKNIRLTPEMGELHIPSGHRHSIRKPSGVATNMKERATDSAAKSRFFEDLFGPGELPNFIHSMSTFWRHGDAYPVIGDYTPHILGKLLVWVFGGFVGNFLGYDRRPDSSKKTT